jgi:hypothetical protein
MHLLISGYYPWIDSKDVDGIDSGGE